MVSVVEIGACDDGDVAIGGFLSSRSSVTRADKLTLGVRRVEPDVGDLTWLFTC